MYNKSLVISLLSGLVGFRNSTISGYDDLVSSANRASSSGLYFNDGFNLVSIKNIIETQEDVDISKSDFNTFLTNKVNNAVISFCNRVTSDKSELIDSGVMFSYEQSFENTQDITSGFVCYRIEPYLNKNILLSINAITTTFDTAFDIPIRLYSSETGTIISSETVSTLADEATRTAVNWELSLARNRSGGAYYLGYYISDLSGAKPYKRDYDLAGYEDTPGYFTIDFQNNSVSGSRIQTSNYDSLTEPYGLNFEYSVYSDWTDLLVKNKYLLARGIQLEMADKIIEQIMTTTRSNIDEQLAKETRNIAAFELEKIRKMLDKEADNVRGTLWPVKRIIRQTRI